MAEIEREIQATGAANVLVYMKDSTDEQRMSAAASRFVGAPNSISAALTRSRVATRGKPKTGRIYEHLGVMLGTVDAESLAALKKDPAVRRVARAPQISLIRPVAARAAKLTASLTWGIRKLKAHRLWEGGHKGGGVKIGHLDTGVDGKHACLRTAIADFVTLDALGAVQKLRPGEKAFDTDGHGTHTAATIAGRPVGGRSVGVAPEAELFSAAVIEGGDVIARILGGLNWAVGRGCTVVNASLGLRGWHDEFLPLTRILRVRGVLPVFAVGNEGPGTSRSPGNYEEALSVGACDAGGLVADFSSSQEFLTPQRRHVPDLVAPGAGVISARPGGSYQSMDGTSMATPHIAGLAALLWSAEPSATVSDIEQAILASASVLTSDGVERQGRGVPDGVRALAHLRA